VCDGESWGLAKLEAVGGEASMKSTGGCGWVRGDIRGWDGGAATNDDRRGGHNISVMTI
jgi:hypothetical protein